MTRQAKAGMRAGSRAVGVVLVTYAVVASAQSLTDCDLAAQRAIQAAHEQYERELRACNNQPACLQGSFDRWIVASKNTEKVRSQCRAQAQIPQRALTPKMDPSAMPPVPGPSQTPQMDPGVGSSAGKPLQGGVQRTQQGAQGYPDPKILQGGTSGTGINTSGWPTKIGCVEIPWDDGKGGKGVDWIQVTVRPQDSGVLNGPTQSRKGVTPYWDYAEGQVIRGGASNGPDEFVFRAVKHDGQPLKPVSDLRTFVDPTGKNCQGQQPSATRPR